MYRTGIFDGFFFISRWRERKKILTSKFKNNGTPTICWFSRSSNRYTNTRKGNIVFKERLNKIYSKHTGKSVKEIASALERDKFLTAEEAKDFGLIDKVVEKRN